MAWRNQAPELNYTSHNRQSSSLLRRALERKERRVQRRRNAVDVRRPSAEASAATSEPGPLVAPASGDMQQLLRRANSLLSNAPGMPTDDLRQRVAELGPMSDVLQALGPMPEVLRTLQDLLRNESTTEPDLPQYSEGNRRV
jgi:hypothetical protein